VAGQVERHAASLAGKQSDHAVPREKLLISTPWTKTVTGRPHIRIGHLPGAGADRSAVRVEAVQVHSTLLLSSTIPSVGMVAGPVGS